MADKLDKEVRQENRQLNLGNEVLFTSFNNSANQMVEMVNYTEKIKIKGSSPQYKNFAQGYSALVEQTLKVMTDFIGCQDFVAYIHFISVWRNVVDVNVIHKKILYDLQENLNLNPIERIKHIVINAKLYQHTKNERTASTYKACMELPVPKIFTVFEKTDIKRLKSTIDENGEVMQSIDTFHSKYNQDTVKSLYEMQERKKTYSSELSEATQELNMILKRWVDQYIKIVLLDN